MDRKDQISPQVLTELCSLYFDGLLNREEEKALRAILTRKDLQEVDGIVAEAIFVMGLERATEKNVKSLKADDVPAEQMSPLKRYGSTAGDAPARKQGRFFLGRALRRIVTASVAAAVVIGCVSAIWSLIASDVNTIDTGMYIVYRNGERVDDPAEAKRIAMANYHEQLARMEEMERLQREVIENIEAENAYAEQMLRKASDMVESYGSQ